jgi:hypothetical protein
MLAAGLGLHPLTDLLFHGRHPFPRPVEHLILEIHALDPRAWKEFASSAESWTRIPDDACGGVIGYLGRVLASLDSGNGRSH